MYINKIIERACVHYLFKSLISPMHAFVYFFTNIPMNCVNNYLQVREVVDLNENVYHTVRSC